RPRAQHQRRLVIVVEVAVGGSAATAGASGGFDRRPHGSWVPVVVDALRWNPAVVERSFFQIGKEEERPRYGLLVDTIAAHRERPLGVVVTLQREPNLLEIVLTLAPPRGFACRLDGRQQKCDQD